MDLHLRKEQIMKLQQRTIQRYRQLFPQETLRQTSHRTGIQITRVFRLFNGKPMKVGELEAFEETINKRIYENPSFAKLQEAVESAATILTDAEISKVHDLIERKIIAKKFSRAYISQKTESFIA
jgi:hypothetical protein